MFEVPNPAKEVKRKKKEVSSSGCDEHNEMDIEVSPSPSPPPDVPTMRTCSLCSTSCSDSEDGLLGKGIAAKLRKQCNVIFLVKNLLRIPLPQCEELLRVYGDPEGWINLCAPCTSILNQALDINEQINQMRKKLDELGEQLTLPLKIKLEEIVDDNEWDESRPSASREIRKFLINGEFEGLIVTPDNVHDEIEETVSDCQTDRLYTVLSNEEINGSLDASPSYACNNDTSIATPEDTPAPEAEEEETGNEDNLEMETSSSPALFWGFSSYDDNDDDFVTSTTFPFPRALGNSKEMEIPREDMSQKNQSTSTRSLSPAVKTYSKKQNHPDKQCRNPIKITKNRTAIKNNCLPSTDRLLMTTTRDLKCITIGSFIIVYREFEGPKPKVLGCRQSKCCFKAVRPAEILTHLKNVHETDDWRRWISYRPKKIDDLISDHFPSEIMSVSQPGDKKKLNVTKISCKLCKNKPTTFTLRSRMIDHLQKGHHFCIDKDCGDEEFSKHAETKVEFATVVKTISIRGQDNDVQQILVHCPFCDFTSQSPPPMKAHINSAHSLFCDIYCKDGVSFLSVLEEENMRMLQVKANGAKPKHKPIPTKHFMRKVKHFKSKTFECDEAGCNLKFRSYNNFKEHKGKVHAVGYPCEHCGVKIRNLRSLENHCRLRHFDKDTTLCVCGGCSKYFSSMLDFQRHLKQADCKEECKEKSLPCTVPSCCYRLENQSTLELHMKVEHLTEYPDPYVCLHCKKGFKALGQNYLNHIRSHVEDISVQCKQCGKVSKNPKCYYQHMRSTHDVHRQQKKKKINKTDNTNAVGIKCSQCFRTFRDHARLKAHESLHKDPLQDWLLVLESMTL